MLNLDNPAQPVERRADVLRQVGHDEYAITFDIVGDGLAEPVENQSAPWSEKLNIDPVLFSQQREFRRFENLKLMQPPAEQTEQSELTGPQKYCAPRKPPLLTLQMNATIAHPLTPRNDKSSWRPLARGRRISQPASGQRAVEHSRPRAIGHQSIILR